MTCCPGAPNAAWIRCDCSASGGSTGVRSGSRPGGSRSSTSRSCCCVRRSGWPRRRRLCRRWVRPNSSARHWRRSRPTRTAGRRARPHRHSAGRRCPASGSAGRPAGAGAGRRRRAAVLAGDPNQAVFGFRGADRPRCCDTDGQTVVKLATSHRCAPAIARAVTGVARLLPGPARARDIAGADGAARLRCGGTGGVRARRSRAWWPTRCAGPTSSTACRGRRWRSSSGRCPRAGAGLPRALAAAGVPVAPPAIGRAAARQRGGAGAADSAGRRRRGLDPRRRRWRCSTGPIGRVDPVTLRQLRRALRRLDSAAPPREFGDLLVAALRRRCARAAWPRRTRGRCAACAPCCRAAGAAAAAIRARRCGRRGIAAVCSADCSTRASGAVWPGCGPTQNLNAVTTLFDVADQFVSRTPGASIPGCSTTSTALRLPGARRRTRAAARGCHRSSARTRRSAANGTWW